MSDLFHENNQPTETPGADLAADPVEGLESGSSAADRSVEDINRDILAGIETPAETPGGDGVQAGMQGDIPLAGVQIPAAAQKSPEKVLREFSMLVGLVARLLKGIFAPAWDIPKSDFEEAQHLWADWLAEEYPQGVPATKLGLAIIGTASLIGAHADKPRYHPAKEGQKTGFWQRLFGAATGK